MLELADKVDPLSNHAKRAFVVRTPTRVQRLPACARSFEPTGILRFSTPWKMPNGGLSTQTLTVSTTCGLVRVLSFQPTHTLSFPRVARNLLRAAPRQTVGSSSHSLAGMAIRMRAGRTIATTSVLAARTPSASTCVPLLTRRTYCRWSAGLGGIR